MGARLAVNAHCEIDEDELVWRFAPSGGPGGQHANRTASRAEVTFNVSDSPSLAEWQRERLLARLGPVVRAAADDERSQWRNRVLARDRLLQRLAEGLRVEPPRHATRPTRSSIARRIDEKRRQGARKRDRRVTGED